MNREHKAELHAKTVEYYFMSFVLRFVSFVSGNFSKKRVTKARRTRRESLLLPKHHPRIFLIIRAKPQVINIISIPYDQ
jgi:hypothetical protein